MPHLSIMGIWLKPGRSVRPVHSTMCFSTAVTMRATPAHLNWIVEGDSDTQVADRSVTWRCGT